MKKAFAIILALLLIVTTLPLAFAETVEGTLRTNHTWIYDAETQTLTINGEGDMGDFWDMYTSPWDAYEKQIKTLVIGDGVTDVGGYLFYNSDLEKVVIGKDVKRIGKGAFWSSYNLTIVEFGESVETIEDYAFAGCKLTEITLPDSLKTIGKEAFVGAKFETLEIPDSVIRIEEGAFRNIPFKSLKIGNGLKTIEKDVFYYCHALKNLVLGSGIETIGETAFESCFELETLVLPEGVKTIEKDAFQYCRKLKNIVFPKSLETIGNSAFGHCESLVDVKIGEGVEYVGMSAFCGCSSLETVEIPASVEIISETVFSGCPQLKEFKVANDSEYYSAHDGVLYNKNKTELIRYPNGRNDIIFEIPKGVKVLETEAFSGATFKRVIIPNTVTSIYGRVFFGCKNLDNVIIPENVTYMNGGVFRNCTSLTNITIPKALKRIYAYTFVDCYNLVTVNYTGSETQWENINIEHSNSPLYDATINFNVKTHSHSYANEVLKESSCTENGSILYKCTCGDVFSVEIPAKGHEFGGWVVTVVPTATTEGEKVRTCKHCGEKEKFVIGTLPVNPEYPDEIMGDLNGDKKITAMDARMVLRYVANIISFDNVQFSNADVNGDGKVTSIDARWILQLAAGMRTL